MPERFSKETPLSKAHESINLSLMIFFLLPILVGAFCIRGNFLSVPFDRDEGTYAAIAQAMLRGELPYRDALDTKPPVTFFIYALSFLLFGQSTFGVHLLCSFFVLGEVILIFLIGSRIAGTFPALLGASLFAVSISMPGVEGFVANNEIFMIFFTLLSFFFFIKFLDGGSLWLLPSGCFAAGAFLTKPPAATDLAGLFLLLLIVALKRQRRKFLSEVFRNWVFLFGGFVLGCVPVLIYLLINGIFRDFIDAVFVYNLSYVSRIPVSLAPKFFWRSFREIIRYDFLLWGLAVPGIFISLSRRDIRDFAAIVFFIFASIGVTLSFQFYPHYFIQVLPPVALSASIAGAALSSAFKARFGSFARYTSLAGLAAAGVLLPIFLNLQFFRMKPEELLWTVFPGNPFAESPAIGEYLSGRTSPSDRIFIFGSEPQILFYAKRRSASRYLVMYPLNLAKDALERQRSVVHELERNRPRYIVFVDIPMSHLLQTGKSPLFLLRSLEEILVRDYEIEAKMEVRVPKKSPSRPFSIRIYRRKSDARGATFFKHLTS